jgi:transposase
MFVRIKTSPYSPRKSVQIVASRREGAKIKQTILRHLGVANNEQELLSLQAVAQLLLRQLREAEAPELLLVPATARRAAAVSHAALKVDLRHLQEQQRQITGFHEIYGKLYEELGFGRVLATPSAHGGAVRLLKQLVMARLAAPLSKRASVRDLGQRFGIQLSLPAVYRMLDRLDEGAQSRLRGLAYTAAKELFGQKIHLVFYDCTTLYFESFEEDELRVKGFSKDNLFSQTQVVLALAVTTEGIPLGYELFPGNIYEGNTFKELLERIKSNWNPSELVVVADSAMLSEANIAILEANGLSYIVGARLKSLKKGTLADKVLALSQPANPQDKPGEDSRTSAIGSIPLDKQSRLVVSFSPLRARKDAHERQKMIEKIKRRLEKTQQVKPLVGKQGYRRFLKLDGKCQVELDESAIQKAAVWDGLHGVRTNLLKLPENQILEQYRGLWQVEDCFRISKHDLRVRPIYHWTEQRIRSHVALCFMALCCVRHLMYRVKLQQEAMSAEAIRRALLSVQVSVYRDVSTGHCYELPGRWQSEVEKLYRTMGVPLRSTARRAAEREKEVKAEK